MATVETPSELLDLEGTDLGITEPVTIAGSQLTDFEASTGADTNWLALSLVNLFLPRLVEVRSFSMGVNVGLESVRFGPPLAAGDRLVGRGRVLSVEKVGEGVQSVVEVTITAVGQNEPACVAATVSRYFA